MSKYSVHVQYTICTFIPNREIVIDASSEEEAQDKAEELLQKEFPGDAKPHFADLEFLSTGPTPDTWRFRPRCGAEVVAIQGEVEDNQSFEAVYFKGTPTEKQLLELADKEFGGDKLIKRDDNTWSKIFGFERWCFYDNDKGNKVVE
jgi:hypothetical protein